MKSSEAFAESKGPASRGPFTRKAEGSTPPFTVVSPPEKPAGSTLAANPLELYWIKESVQGQGPPDDVLERFSEAIRHIINKILTSPAKKRQDILEGWLAAFPGNEAEILGRLMAIDLAAGPPILDPADDDPPITAAHLLKGDNGDEWAWRGWIGLASLLGLFAVEGLGKTRLFFDLVRRIALGLEWPDGQAPTFPVGSRSLWLCSDGNHMEVAREAQKAGIEEFIIFNGTADDPYGFTDLDDPETLERLESNMAKFRPAMVIIDTLTNATGKNLCAQSDVKQLAGPLKDLCLKHKIPILFSMHANKEGDVLGKRMRGVCRTLMKLEAPDENEPNPAPGSKLRLSMHKSYAAKPAAIGVTIGDDGNAYSSDVPPPVPKSKVGRPDVASQKAQACIIEILANGNDRKVVDLAQDVAARTGTSDKTAINAIYRMRDAGLLCIDETSRPKIVHLNKSAAAPGQGGDNDPVF